RRRQKDSGAEPARERASGGDDEDEVGRGSAPGIAADRSGVAHVRRRHLSENPRHDGAGRHVRSHEAAGRRVPSAEEMSVAAAAPAAAARRPWIHGVEDVAASLLLAAMVVLPLADAALRSTLHVGISSSALIVQHLGLLLGMLGGAIAAREGRLLALSTLGDR